MTIASTASRSLRIGNETPLSGNESLASEGGEVVNSIIPIATEDHPIVSLANFTKANLMGLLLTCDRDALVRMRGDFHYVSPDVAHGFTAAAIFDTNEDVTEWLWAGDKIWIDDATTAGNDGTATVLEVAYAAPYSTITIMREGAAYNVEIGVAGVTRWRKIQARSQEFLIDGAVAGAPNEFIATSTINAAGDYSFLQAHDKIMIQAATNAANNDIFEVVTAVFDGVDTVITVEEVTIVTETSVALTSLQWIRDELMVRITAGIPELWTLNGNGILNPVLEDITTLLVSNAHATLTADFQARIIKVPV